MLKKANVFKNVIACVSIVFVLVICVLAGKSDLYHIDSPYTETIHIPIDSWEILNDEEYTKDGKFAFQRTFKKEEFAHITSHPSIVFGSVNVKIRVFCNDEQCYSFSNNGKRYVGYESGDSGHFIRIPEKHFDEFTLRIEYMPFSKNYEIPRTVPPVILGTMASLIYEFRKITFPAGLMSYVILAIGLMGLFFTVAFWIALKKFPVEYLSWSLFATLSGVGFLVDSHFVDFALANSFLTYFIPTIILAIMPAVFHVYAYSNKTLACNNKVMTAFSIGAFILVLIDCFAAIAPVFPFSGAKTLTNIYVIVFLFFIIAIQISDCITYKGSFSVPVVLFFCSAIAIMVDLGMNIIPPDDEIVFVVSKPIFLIYFIVQTIYVINDFFNVQVLSARKEMYESTVSQDVLTGTLSRYMFWKYRAVWQKKNTDDKLLTTLVLCEISNLRSINENFGFDKGDESIKIVGALLQQNFSSNSVYRFDLATFAVLVEGMSEDILDRKIHDIQEYLKDYNRSVPDPISVHFGCGFYDKERDETFDAFVTKTQMLLYKEA